MKSKPVLKRIIFDGLDAIELRTASVRLVAITVKGPRIAFWGRPGGRNLLLWAPGKYRRGAWDMMGGHRLWAARPGADEAEETYAADNGPCTVKISARGFTVIGAPDPALNIRRGFTVTMLADGRIALDHFLRNDSDMLWSGGLWAITCTVPSARSTYLLPLGDGSAWDYATIVAFHTWGGGHGGKGFDDPQFKFTREALVLRPSGRENKRMLKADAGIMALHDPAQKLLFAKHSAYDPAGNYPLGTNLALYIGPKNFMVEMETMGPAVTLKPGQTLKHRETWLLAAAKSAPTAKELRQLF
ncbi:MAG: hypothetical protein JWQ83_2197 [Lacunisphaera sp.]|jgi:hypothetical protein|nr:hypothetical protein [Lacunisphaera sp.]MDB6167057.1 hypothetical protein [Lacunisphaera sp.]